MTSLPSTFDLLRQWDTAPVPLLIVDEVRRPDDVDKELVFFVFVATTTKDAVAWVRDGLRAREDVPEQTATASIKGSQLFGKKQRKGHEFLRQFVFRRIAEGCRFSVLATTSRAIAECDAECVFRAVADDGTVTVVTGPELAPLVSCIRALKELHYPDAPRVEVLVDRSRQLGFAPAQRQNVDEAKFESFAGTLHDDDPAVFRIVSASDRGDFSDLLLLPDALGYLGAYVISAFNPLIEQIRSGTSFYVSHAGRELLVAAALAKAAVPSTTSSDS